MKLGKAVKHMGEKEAGINLQMRFVPLKRNEKDKEPDTENIIVAIDENRRAEGENQLKVKLPVLTMLNGQGVQFIDNLIALRDQIFELKGWIDHRSLRHRLEHIQKLLKGLAARTFVAAIKDARKEFLEHTGVDASLPNSSILLSNENAFETWLQTNNVLIDGLWLLPADAADQDAVAAAVAKALKEYEQCIMWNAGKHLWNDHGEAYENHYLYFNSQIIKPYNMPVEEFDYKMKLYAERLKLMQPPSMKKTKSFALGVPTDPTPVTLATVYNPNDKHEEVKMNMLVLFDDGSSGSMIKGDIVKPFLQEFRVNQNVEYMTGAGPLACKQKIQLQVSFDEFGGATRVIHDFDVDPNPEGIGYDMIIGRDLLTKLQIDIRFSDRTIKWEDKIVQMKSFSDIWEGIHPTREEMRATFIKPVEPRVTREETERVVKILDANYEKANLEEVVENATSLNREQKRKLLKTLKKFESLFDGTLGRWKTDPVKIQLKEGAKAVNSRWYPVPKINKETFKKELEQLVKIGVLEVVHESEWGTPVFIIPKKEGTVRFVTDFRKVNGQVVRKPFPIPRIADTLQQLEGFTFATALDLNMGY